MLHGFALDEQVRMAPGVTGWLALIGASSSTGTTATSPRMERDIKATEARILETLTTTAGQVGVVRARCPAGRVFMRPVQYKAVTLSSVERKAARRYAQRERSLNAIEESRRIMGGVIL